MEGGGEASASAPATAVGDLVEFLCRALAEEPDSVTVEEIDEGNELVIEVSVEGGDLGRLIGRGGRVANAIRTVAKAAARAGDNDRRVLVEFVED
jgi:predicted RNA-binding protein YlqC (UPF0109 family)